MASSSASKSGHKSSKKLLSIPSTTYSPFSAKSTRRILRFVCEGRFANERTTPRQRRIMTAQSKQVGPRGRLAFQPRASSRRRAFRNPHYSRKTLFRDLPRTGGFLMRSTPYIYSWTKRPLKPPAAPAGKIPLNQRLAVAFQKPFRILSGGGGFACQFF